MNKSRLAEMILQSVDKMADQTVLDSEESMSNVHAIREESKSKMEIFLSIMQIISSLLIVL
jgi:DNA-binding transcriptional regulator YiaG